MLRLVAEEPKEEDALSEANAEGCGAVVLFRGRVREKVGEESVLHLEYEAFPEMAEKKMSEIEGDLSKKYPLGKIAVIHRVGRALPGETTLLIAVSSPHRKEAFEACAECLERVKHELPVWKKETTATTSRWVDNGCGSKTEPRR